MKYIYLKESNGIKRHYTTLAGLLRSEGITDRKTYQSVRAALSISYEGMEFNGIWIQKSKVHSYTKNRN